MYKKAAMVGGGLGAVMGILSIIPLISCLNCILAFAPGPLTVFLAKQDGEDIGMGSGAAGGAVSGVCMSVVSSIISLPLSLLFAGGQLHQALQQANLGEAAAGGVMLVVVFGVVIVIALIIFAAVNAITGLIASAILNR